MKKIVMITTLLLLATTMFAQNAEQARKVLDKTAAIVSNKTGASANFTISGKYGNSSGSISIKGQKFMARTPQAIMWFDGKTQWTYMKKNQEVNVTNPDAAKQQAMNPYAFISLYKKGYNLDMKTVGTNYQVHLTAQNKKNAIKEMYILVNKSSYKLTQIKMRQSNGWTTINVSNLQTKNLSDNTFRFNAKDYPQAEIIDLR
jgi:outer membrane lipoprotein-sorting protein